MKKMSKFGKSILLSSLAVIAFGGIAAGSTYALFTSEANTNVTVSTGKVNVSTAIDTDSIKLYSLDETTGESTELTDKDTFTNGGSFSYNASTGAIVLDKFTPGDKVEFEVTAKNDSDVNIKYRTVLKTLEDNGLFQGLKVTIDGAEYDGSTTVSDYKDVIAEANLPKTSYKFSIELPKDAGNEYQDKKCTISFKLEAVQGNAKVSNPNQTVYEIYTPLDLVAFAKKIDSNQSITYEKVVLMNDIDMSGIKYVSPNYAASNHLIEFDGGSHTIKNFAPSQSEDSSHNKFIGLIGNVGVGSAYIHDIYFENVSMKGEFTDYTIANDPNLGGGVVVGMTAQGASKVEIKNVQLSGDISIDNVKYAGGFVGYTTIDTTISGCSIQSTAKVSISGYTAGGVLGQNGGKTTTISDIAIGSDISVAAYKREGGLVGAGSGGTTTTISFTDNALSRHLKISNKAIAAQGTYVGLVSNTTINGVQYYTAINGDDVSKITVDKTKAAIVELGEGKYNGYLADFKGITGGIKVVGRGELDNITWVQTAGNNNTYDTAEDKAKAGWSFQSTDVEMDNVTITTDTATNGYMNGFINAKSLVFNGCKVVVDHEHGAMGFWGDSTATFNSCSFVTPNHTPESNLFTYSGTEFNFDNCTFTSEESAIKLYKSPDTSSGQEITINITGCHFNSTCTKAEGAKYYKAVLTMDMDSPQTDNNHYSVNMDSASYGNITGNFATGIAVGHAKLIGLKDTDQKTYYTNNITVQVGDTVVDLGLSAH